MAEKMMDYDAEEDSFFIYSKDRHVKGSVDFGDFMLDFDDNGNVAGIEILNASTVLEGLGVTKEMLSTAIKAGFTTSTHGDAMYIYFGIIMPNRPEARSMVAIPAIRHR